MTSETLLSLIRAEPFRPFVLHKADGERVVVPDPQVIAHEAGRRTALVVHEEDEGYSFVDLSLVTRAEVGDGDTEGR